MSAENETNDVAPAFPVGTVITSLLVFLFFAFLIGMVYYYANQLDVTVPVITGEQKLQELQADQQKIITSYGYDKATNSIRVPVDVAAQKSIDEAKNHGKLPFPKKMPAAETPKEAVKDAPKEPVKK
jgi:hypothetical protein